jgi:hypothetical protein
MQAKTIRNISYGIAFLLFLTVLISESSFGFVDPGILNFVQITLAVLIFLLFLFQKFKLKKQ